MMSLCSSIIAQTNRIDDIVNEYAKVTGISGSIVTLSTNASSIFAVSDTVLLIQMTGVTIDGNEVKNAGRYEFHIVTDVNGQNVTLLAPPGSFDPTELVQLIRVPSYKNAEITNKGLTCQPWKWADGTGGVLALMVEGTLTVNGNIDVSGRGFKGGDASGEYAGDCSFDPPYNRSGYAANDFDLAGNKGEGAVTTSYYPGVNSANVRGFGKTYNGGGGGNGKWSGGGGGANGGYGGRGGNQLCGKPASDSVFLLIRYLYNEGYAFKYDEPFWMNPSKHAFMGGGGGAGTGFGTAGGNGGGIVIIVAQKFQFLENTAIKANGASVGGAPSEAGSGGGGAGGSVLLSVEDYGEIKVEIEGGNGGNVNKEINNPNHSQGAGGGGGGGFLITSKTVNQANITKTGGEQGILTSEWGRASKGEDGFSRSDFQVQLRGFLRNFIITPDTTVCYGDDYSEPVTIRASQPLGGDGNYVFRWQTSTNGIWIDIENSNTRHLTHKFIHDTIVRRVVTSENITDEGSSVKINVFRKVTNEIAPTDTTLCWQESFEIRGSVPTGGGNGTYSYQWQEFVNNQWINKSASKNLPVEFSSGNEINTYRYRRIITSIPAGCVSVVETSDIIVQPVIKYNAITSGDQKVCDDVEQIKADKPEGGDGNKPDYQWQISTDRENWKDLTDEDADQQNYTPQKETTQILSSEYYQDRYYRRIVTSGACKNASNYVTIRFDQHPSKAKILTDLMGDSLKFKFTMDLEAERPVVGAGKWWSTMEKLDFDRPNEWITKVNYLQFGDNTIYWEVKVSDSKCDPSYDMINLKVVDIMIPTGFSPNGDDYNQCFRIVGAENATSSELIIIDRYNNVVFESKSFMGSSDLNNCTGWWDGRSSSGKELPNGIYFYQFTLNGDKVYKGYVALKR